MKKPSRDFWKDSAFALASVALAFAYGSLTWKRDLPNLFRIRAGRPLAEQAQEPNPSLKFTGARGRPLRPFLFTGRTFDVFYFDHVNQPTAEFARATLQATSFTYATLPFANFNQADFRGSYFERASLRGADLRASHFAFTNIIQSDLTGADLRDADLTSARILLTKLEGALFNENTKLPFSEAEAIARGMKRAK
ncbi:MAG: pentapeptide repeat-containing protein [Proteobacteria bacterium]|nr:MAG: pentapeptide repeat-containing protein [Pseudomonadota bacterium]